MDFSPPSKLKEGIGFTLGFISALGVMFSKKNLTTLLHPKIVKSKISVKINKLQSLEPKVASKISYSLKSSCHSSHLGGSLSQYKGKREYAKFWAKYLISQNSSLI